MPEGHTVHRLARDHAKTFAGQTILVSSPQGRFEKEARSLNKKTLANVDAHGKHLFYQWVNPKAKRPRTTVMHVHLGLYGKYRLHKNPPPEPRGAVRVRLIGDEIRPNFKHSKIALGKIRFGVMLIRRSLGGGLKRQKKLWARCCWINLSSLESETSIAPRFCF